jgi:hypothetical protein
LILLWVPVVLSRLSARISRGTFRIVASDFLVIIAGIWMFVAASAIDGIGSSLAHSGPVTLEF